ncbi:AI-2E family transporter [Metabacillus herbersteinensis]|uniref:AI-2E family transporter n=1 Tax=Metabacillus herbersteinensis TaxID=283816 RepID=A0ABV6G8X7_9BACI
MRDRQIKWILHILIFLLGLLSVYLFFKLQMLWDPFFIMFKAIFFPFLIAAFITYLLHPVIEKLHSTGVPRSLSIIIIYFLFFGAIGYGFYRGVPILIEQLRDLSESFPQLTETYNSWIEKIKNETNRWPDGIHERVDDLFARVENGLASLIERLINSLRGIFDYLIILAIIPFLVFYMLKDHDSIKKAAWYLTPRKWRSEAIQFLKEIDKSLGSYIRGQLLICLIIGTIAFLSLWFFKIKYPLIIGLLIGITNIIPYFGPIIGAFPAVIIAATMSTKTIIIVIIIIGSLQFLEGNILGPLIVGKSIHMHPIVIMFALLAGGEIGGIFGLMLAVPILVILKVILIHVVQLKREH